MSKQNTNTHTIEHKYNFSTFLIKKTSRIFLITILFFFVLFLALFFWRKLIKLPWVNFLKEKKISGREASGEDDDET